jgi:hypothetical protein
MIPKFTFYGSIDINQFQIYKQIHFSIPNGLLMCLVISVFGFSIN